MPMVESGTTFVPEARGSTFHIEKSSLYEACPEGVRVAEFVVLESMETADHLTLWVVEAKSSLPRKDVDASHRELIEKLDHTLKVLLRACSRLGTADVADLPAAYQQADLARVKRVCYLVIINSPPDAPKDWLVPHQDGLRLAAARVVEPWAMRKDRDVVVIDRARAVKNGWVLPDGP